MSPVNEAMTRTSFRLPVALVERVDRYAEQKSAEVGMPVNRTQAVIFLLNDALNRLLKE